jgi:PAS domain S-box-containing protein
MRGATAQAGVEAPFGDAEARLRDFLEVSSDWIWETDAALRFSFFSEGLEPITGTPREKLLGKTRREIFSDPDAPEVKRHLAELDARRPFRGFTYATRTARGRRWFRVSGKPVYDADGVFRGYRGIGSDVTVEVEATQRAEELHARFAEALESVPASIMLCDGEDRIVLFNSITRSFFPYAAAFLVPGVRFEDLVRAQGESGFIADANGRVEEWVRERMDWHRNPKGALTRLYGDGRWIQIIERRTSDGGHIGIRVDVTELKNKERELARKSALLEATLDNIAQGLSAFDGELRLTAHNKRFLALLGFPEHLGTPGTHFSEFVRFNAERGEYGPGDVEEQVAARLALARKPTPHRFERIRPDGSILDVTGQPLPDGGFVTTYTDVTEQRRAEKQLAEHARELERSNSELEQFAYVASHDLQEPLRMVASYCQLLQRRYKGKLDDDADEFIGFAVEGATRMQRMINELLNYSRVGRKSAGFAPVACREAVEAALAGLAAAVEEAGATVTVGDLPTVVGEAALLQQLFQNLVGNALKFRRDGVAPEITIGAERGDGLWRFTVADNGIGIEAEYADRIFLLFQRLHERTKYPGTGIGLALCKKVVEHHGGRIWVESEPGKGSRFNFTIPDPARTP